METPVLDPIRIQTRNRIRRVRICNTLSQCKLLPNPADTIRDWPILAVFRIRMVFIWYGSGSSILGCIWYRSGSGSKADPEFWSVLWIRNDFFRIGSRIRIRLFREFRIRSRIRIRILLRIRILYEFVWICIFIYLYVHTHSHTYTRIHTTVYM